MAERRKPLAFDTTMRNPQRMASFVSIISKYENKKLTSSLILKIEALFIRQKIFKPKRSTLGNYVASEKDFKADDQSVNAENQVSQYYDEWKDSDPFKNPIDLWKVIYLLKNTITKHQVPGYKFGWESRFQTHISFCNELGFTLIEKGKSILISDTGKLLISKYENGYQVDDYDSDPEHTAYLNAFAKYQTNNPWRKNTITVNFLYLFLSTVKCLDEKFGSKGVNRKELPFFIVWPDNDYSQLADFVNNFRKIEGKNCSPEVVYDYAMNILDENAIEKCSRATESFKKKKRRDYKIEKITKETPDDVMRKLRQSQTVSLRGNGNYLDINHFEDDKVEWIISKYGKNYDFATDSSKLEYFKYMGNIDSKLEFNSANISEEKKRKIDKVRLQVVNDWAARYEWDQLSKEINIACQKKESKDIILREIDSPTRMEFLAAIIMKKSLKNALVIPHYKVDDEGIPYDTASGGNKNNIGTDIDVIENKSHALLEPTISGSRSIQVEHEIPSIRNHVLRTIKKEQENKSEHKNHFAIFLAWRVDSDVGDEIAAAKFNNNIDIYPWEVRDYIEKARIAEKLTDYTEIKSYSAVHKAKYDKKIVNIYLTDGNEDGRYQINLYNWNVKSYMIPRKFINKSSKLDEINTTGIFFLFGSRDGKDIVYIDAAENVYKQLEKYFSIKDDCIWSKSVAFVSGEIGRLDKTQLIYLKTSLCTIINKDESNILLSDKEHKNNAFFKCNLKAIVDNIRLIISVLGYTIFS